MFCNAALNSDLEFINVQPHNSMWSVRLAPMWQQSGTVLLDSCHGIAGFIVDELQI